MACRQLNARERKRVYMHSTIFDNGGPTSKSIYGADQQKDINAQLGDSLRPREPPSMDLPTAGDIRCTQNAGHAVVLPSHIGVDSVGSPPLVPPTSQQVAHKWYKDGTAPRTSNPEVLVNDGDLMPVLKAGARDKEFIPQEFRFAGAQLAWDDPRNERSRPDKNRHESMTAQELKLQEMSSEMFGKVRMTNCSTENPGAELLQAEADYLQMDSALDRNNRQTRQTANVEKVTAHDRFTHNLTGSRQPAYARPEPLPQEEDPSTVSRRRQEKNFSDLFGTNMAERSNVRNREEVISTANCSVLDTRVELGTRNSKHWQVGESDLAGSQLKEKPHVDQLRKDAERSSRMFDRSSPAKPRTNTADVVVAGNERPCWDTRDIMDLGSEIARRTRAKDFDNNMTAQDRKSKEISSQQARRGFGGDYDDSQPQFSPRGGNARSSRLTEAPQMRGYGAPGARPITAKETKLAFLQSNIFN